MATSRASSQEEASPDVPPVGWSGPHTLEEPTRLRANAPSTSATSAPHTLPLRFVDGLDKTYSTETRVHIARRQQDGKRNKRPSIRDSQRKSAPTEGGQSTAATESSAITPYPTNDSLSPATFLSQTRADPFDTLARRLTPLEQFYLDRCRFPNKPGAVNKLITHLDIGLSGVYSLRRTSRFHPPRDIIFPPCKGAEPALLVRTSLGLALSAEQSTTFLS